MGAKIISIINNKGGVGKSTLTSLVAIYLGSQKFRVLVIDNDPQGNTSKTLKYKTDNDNEEISFSKENSMYALFSPDGKEPSNEIIIKTDYKNVDVVPNIFLTNNHEKKMMNEKNFKDMLRLKMFTEKNRENYDIILIDNNPAVNIFSTNSLFASDFVIIPTDMSRYSQEGIVNLVEYIYEIKQVNKELTILGIIATRVDLRKKLHKETLEIFKESYKNILFETILKENAGIETVISDKRKFSVKNSSEHNGYKMIMAIINEIIEKAGMMK